MTGWGQDMTTDAEPSVSGLCLRVRPGRLDGVESELRELGWLEIHARDDATGRLIVVQEHDTVKAHQDGLRLLQSLPNVLTADLVVHRRLTSVDSVGRGTEDS
jgi:nitrate reductase NapAB chaperone NapD